MIRAVLDTNILVSAVINSEGPPGRVVQTAAEGCFQPVVSPLIMTEYQSVLGRKKFGVSPATVELIISSFRRIAIEVVPSQALLVSKDPGDNKFLECAVAAGATYLVTGNLKHFPRAFAGVQILAPAAFLRALGQ